MKALYMNIYEGMFRLFSDRKKLDFLFYSIHVGDEVNDFV